VLQFLPNPPLTPDQVQLLKRDNVVSGPAAQEGRTLAGLGIEPRAVAGIVPAYLWRYRRCGQFTRRLA
jgi:NADH dehydrogenase